MREIASSESLRDRNDRKTGEIVCTESFRDRNDRKMEGGSSMRMFLTSCRLHLFFVVEDELIYI